MVEPRVTGEKKCSRCKEVKHVLCFGARKASKDGLNSACRECTSRAARRRYRDNKPTSPNPITKYFNLV